MGNKRGIISLVFMVAVVLSGMLTACSGQSSASARVTKDIRASSGGSISGTHGVTLTIPANALSGDAHVTLADTGQPAHAKGDPLGPISDSFTVTATPLTGNATITLTHPATLQIVTHPTQKGQDILVAEMASASQGEVHLHYALTIKNDIITARYGELGGREWAVFLPIALPQVTPTEGNVLQVPWYDQSGVSWCVPTSLAELLRYYDFNEKAGDPLNATFGPTTALANWQIAGQSHQAAGGGDGYDEAINIGLPSPTHSDSGGTEARITTYLWDDNFFFTAPGDTPATQDLTHYDFQDYVTLINTGVFGLAERKPVAMLVDAWYHSVVIVGVDSKGVFLHNSNGGIAVHMNWADLFTQAHTYRTDAAGKSNEIHTIWTGVVYNLPVKPLEKRTGSVVIKRDDVWFTDSTMSRVTLDWDGIGTHGAGYYFKDSSDASANGHLHGTAAFRNTPLHYGYRVANVSNLTLTFHTFAELSGPNYGADIVRQSHNMKVPPYSVSDTITGSFPAFPAGASAIFAVRLSEINEDTINQDVKFVRIDLHDTLFTPPRAPVVHITTPASNTHVTANVPFRLAGSVSVPSGEKLSDIVTVWSVNDVPIATGTETTTTLTTPGYANIKFSVTDAYGQTSNDRVTLIVDPQPPTVTILAPSDGQAFTNVTNAGQQLTLVSTGSAGVTRYSWSDSIAGELGTGKSLTITLYPPRVINCGASQSRVLTLTGSDDSGQHATSQATITLAPPCVR